MSCGLVGSCSDGEEIPHLLQTQMFTAVLFDEKIARKVLKLFEYIR
jgi:hypothetical protein